MRKFQARWWKEIPQARYQGVVVVDSKLWGLGVRYLVGSPFSAIVEWIALPWRDTDRRQVIIQSACLR